MPVQDIWVSSRFTLPAAPCSLHPIAIGSGLGSSLGDTIFWLGAYLHQPLFINPVAAVPILSELADDGAAVPD